MIEKEINKPLVKSSTRGKGRVRLGGHARIVALDRECACEAIPTTKRVTQASFEPQVEVVGDYILEFRALLFQDTLFRMFGFSDWCTSHT